MSQLSLLFSRVLVPKAVRRELLKRRLTKHRLKFLFETYAFIQRCDGYEKGTIEFLLAERRREGAKDHGEVEAIVQAVDVGAAVIVDDLWGRNLAARNALDFHGTLWVLQRFYELGLLSSTALRDCFLALRRRGIRLPWNTVNAYLLEIGEDAI